VKRSVGEGVVSEWIDKLYATHVDLSEREYKGDQHQAWLTRIETGMTTQDDADIAKDMLDELANLGQIMASALSIAENELDKAR